MLPNRNIGRLRMRAFIIKAPGMRYYNIAGSASYCFKNLFGGRMSNVFYFMYLTI